MEANKPRYGTLPNMAYLAISYTGSLGKKCPPYRKELSFLMANAVAAGLIEQGELIYSPISHSHPIHQHMVKFAHDHSFWMQYDDEMMEFCDRLYVVKVGDWECSPGVKHEIEWFLRKQRPIFMLDIDERGDISKEEFKLALLNGHVPPVVVEQLRLF